VVKFRSPVLGFNHNIRHLGWLFHVQTEDSGVQNPHLFTHLFHEGVILATKKMVYDAEADGDIVKGLMQAQHKSVLRELKHGAFDDKIRQYLGEAPPDVESEGDEIPTEAPAIRPVVPEPAEVSDAFRAIESASPLEVPEEATIPVPEPELVPAPVAAVPVEDEAAPRAAAPVEDGAAQPDWAPEPAAPVAPEPLPPPPAPAAAPQRAAQRPSGTRPLSVPSRAVVEVTRGDRSGPRRAVEVPPAPPIAPRAVPRPRAAQPPTNPPGRAPIAPVIPPRSSAASTQSPVARPAARPAASTRSPVTRPMTPIRRDESVVVARPAVVIGAPPQVIGGPAPVAPPAPAPQVGRAAAHGREQTTTANESIFGQDLISEKSLDEVIMAYLSEDANED
jgi:hypothetical protein